jgi:hypothetical protein
MSGSNTASEHGSPDRPRRRAARPAGVELGRVAHTIFPGFRFAPGSVPSNSALHHADAGRRDVLREPLGVLGADRVVVGERAAVVDERLLDRRT